MELPFVFGTDWSYGANFTFAEKALTRRMQQLWTTFGHDLRPAPASHWPVFDTGKPQGLLLQTGPSGDGSVVEDVDFDRCLTISLTLTLIGCGPR